MPWLQLSVSVSRDQVEAASACLEAQGAVAVTVSGAGEEVVLEPDPGSQPLWHQVRLQALLDPAADLASLRPALEALAGSLLDVEIVADDDWQSAWRAHAVRACFAGRLWLLPRDEPFDPPDAGGAGLPVLLRLDPGLAFGSGSHPTTRLCLEALAGMTLSGRRVLDFGCGSGVLGLAAALLGAGRVVAVDHDPQALLATRENASYNQIDADRLRVLTPQALADAGEPPFDVVVANVLAKPLAALAPVLTGHTGPAGRLLLSGLLHSQAAMIRDAYPQICFAEPPRCEQEWICLEGSRQQEAGGRRQEAGGRRSDAG